jgi:hypothetical protein
MDLSLILKHSWDITYITQQSVKSYICNSQGSNLPLGPTFKPRMKAFSAWDLLQFQHQFYLFNKWHMLNDNERSQTTQFCKYMLTAWSVNVKGKLSIINNATCYTVPEPITSMYEPD